MTDAIKSRGPDADGFWFDTENGVALGHRRLAIIELSSAGAQPMQSACGRYVIAYNGEIYNFVSLRAELESSNKAPQWRGHSDTEVLLAAIVAWGMRGALERAHGMFALALWDREQRRLILARDRIGEKPLYYGWQGVGSDRKLLFGSDLAALTAHPSFQGTIEPEAVRSLTRLGYVAGPNSIYRGINKLGPGIWIEFSLDTKAESAGKWHRFWSLQQQMNEASEEGPLGSEEAVDRLHAVLGSAIERQMVSDVPLGAFLSGGIDSSVVVALMQERAARPVKTFTIGSSEAAYDEADAARGVARHLRTDHHEMMLGPRDALDLIPRLPSIYTEPFADSSQLPTYLVSAFAKTQVTVALTGDGGDELFGGYNRHVFAAHMWPRIAAFPRPLRRAAARMLLALPAPTLNRLGARFFANRIHHVGDKLYKMGLVTGSPDLDSLYGRLVSHGYDHKDFASLGPPLVAASGISTELLPATRIMALDMTSYLPDDILVKVDRAAMANSLETRVPMLDLEVIHLALRIPVGDKIANGKGKWPLRRLLKRFVPLELYDRPKMGFGVPLDEWLRGPLREWGDALVDLAARDLEGHVDPIRIRRLWAEHQSGVANRQHQLWPMLVFADWAKHWGVA